MTSPFQGIQSLPQNKVNRLLFIFKIGVDSFSQGSIVAFGLMDGAPTPLLSPPVKSEAIKPIGTAPASNQVNCKLSIISGSKPSLNPPPTAPMLSPSKPLKKDGLAQQSPRNFRSV
jgi:hypothetical protein